jgi:KipI family sensor histidine kinase inhibitor
MRIVRAGDQAFLVVFDDAIASPASAEVRRLREALTRRPVAGQIDLHPAYASLLVRFDAVRAAADDVEAGIRRVVAATTAQGAAPSRSFEIPVRYGGADGPDLEAVARMTGLTVAEVVDEHARGCYEVSFLGFSPGFPYLTGLPARLATPRHAVPRTRVPPGSVAIAGSQAGIYPLATAGGWNLIGRTSVALFDPSRTPPALLAPGDRVQFVPERTP